MEGLKIQKSYNAVFRGDVESPKAAVAPKTEPMANDTVEISSKKQDKKGGFGKVAAMLAALTVVIAGGTFGGVKIYDKYFQKLASGIRKGEIDEALFNFIKKNDPYGNVFNNRSEILKINEKLTDDNFLILKQLAKMKDEQPWMMSDAPKRFELHDITELLSNTNESNIKYLEQLARKSENKYGMVSTFKTNDILTVLKNINPQNDKVTGQLIEITGIDDSAVLAGCLSKVNKDNVDIYQLLLSTRKKGGPTELKLDEIQKIASKLEDTKNPKCAELFLNTEKQDGTGMFRHTADEISEMLDFAKDEKYDTYKKLYELKSTAEVENLAPLMRAVNDDNIDLVDRLLTKKHNCFSSEYVIFDDWSNIEKIMKTVTKENKGTASELLDMVNGKRLTRYSQYGDFGSWSYGSKSTDEAFKEFLEELNSEPEKLKKAQQILADGKVDGKQTLSTDEFFRKYDGYK